MKKNIILIKYGDLYLKGKNKKVFIGSLIKNIKTALTDFDTEVITEFDNAKIFIENYSDKNNIVNILKCIPGISYIIPCTIIKREIELFQKEILLYFLDIGTFKVETKRKDKKFDISSDSFNRIIGTWILKNSKYKVDVHHPDILLKIEITEKHFIYYFKKIKGVSGLPIGLNGKALVLLSGGIDSPVAGYLLQRKGLDVHYITFITPPHTSDESLQKVKDLVEQVSLNGKINKSHLYIVNFTNIIHEISHIDDEEYKIIIMRRIFFKIAYKIAKKINADCIATGDSLGQVASQTIESMNCISEAISGILIFRPLLSHSKEEIILIAKEIGTYNISILPYDDACSLFVPKKPVTRPRISKVKEIENKLYYIDELINNIVNNINE